MRYVYVTLSGSLGFFHMHIGDILLRFIGLVFKSDLLKGT